MDEPAIDALRDARRAEKEQTLFYRALAAAADAAGDAALTERLNELLADEQHHLSRLTARLLELGVRPEPLDETFAPPNVALAEWADAARAHEAAEVARYEEVARLGPDSQTLRLIQQICETERRHLCELAGKWTLA